MDILQIVVLDRYGVFWRFVVTAAEALLKTGVIVVQAIHIKRYENKGTRK